MKKHTTKMIALMMAAGAAFTLTACGGDAQNTQEPMASEIAEVQATASPSATPTVSAVPSPAVSPIVTAVPTAVAEEIQKPRETPETKSSKSASGKEKSEKIDSSEQSAASASEPEVPSDQPEQMQMPEPTPDPTPEPTPESQMEWSGDSYGSAVCEGVNEVREMYGMGPLSYGGSGGLDGEVEQMAREGSIWGANSRRSVSKSNDGGKSMGIFSATHASEIAQGDYSTIYVASVKYNGKRYTIVEAG